MRRWHLFWNRKTWAAVEFISVVLERWSFGRLLVELYWSFDINTKFRDTFQSYALLKDGKGLACTEEAMGGGAERRSRKEDQ